MADRIALTLTRSLILDERTGKGTATFQKLDEGQAGLRIGFREWKMEIFYSEEGGATVFPVKRRPLTHLRVAA